MVATEIQPEIRVKLSLRLEGLLQIPDLNQCGRRKSELALEEMAMSSPKLSPAIIESIITIEGQNED